MKKLITLLLLMGIVSTASAKNYTVTFIDGKAWGNVTVRMYNSTDGNIQNAAHPGVSMTPNGTRTVNGIALNVYTYEITSESTFDKLYFVKEGGGGQTGNLDYTDDFEFLISADRTVYLRNNQLASWTTDDASYQSIGVYDATNTQDVFQFTIDAANISTNTFQFRPKASDEDYEISPSSSTFTFSFENGQWQSYDSYSDNNDYKNTGRSFEINHSSINASKYLITVYIKYESWGWKYTTKAEIATMPLNISSYGVATFCCNRALDFSKITDITTSAITNADRTTGLLTLASKGRVPANTGLLIEGDEGTYHVPVITTAEAEAVGTNLLVGVLTDTHIFYNEGGANYILTNRKKGNETFVTPDPLKFYLVNDVSGNTILAGKAYLQIPNPGEGVRDSYWLDEGTGIAVVEKTKNAENEKHFNLAGQYVTRPTKGLYIVNGKKVIIK